MGRRAVRPRISLIAAVAENGVIGAGQTMPWRLSSDLKRFRQLTMGKPVVMGRKTFETIGKPLAGRTNIVVSRRNDVAGESVVVASSLEEALRAGAARGADEVMIIGGGQVYADAMPLADRLYITHVAARPDGDIHFPTIDPALWRPVSEERYPAGEKDSAATRFVIYEHAGERRRG